MACSLGGIQSSQRGRSCQDCPLSVGRFQRSILTKECTNNLSNPEVHRFFRTRHHGSLKLLYKSQRPLGRIRYQTTLTCNQMKAHNDQKEEDWMMQFLMGLNDTYNGIRSNILMMTPLPNVRQAYTHWSFKMKNNDIWHRDQLRIFPLRLQYTAGPTNFQIIPNIVTTVIGMAIQLKNVGPSNSIVNIMTRKATLRIIADSRMAHGLPTIEVPRAIDKIKDKEETKELRATKDKGFKISEGPFLLPTQRMQPNLHLRPKLMRPSHQLLNRALSMGFLLTKYNN